MTVPAPGPAPAAGPAPAPVPRNRLAAAARIEAVAGPGGTTRLPVLSSQAPLVLRRTPSAVYLVGGAAGPIGGDELSLSIAVGPGAFLRMRTAAASIALPGPDGAESVLRVSVSVAAGGRLEYLPEPVVVSNGARHATLISVTLAAGASLVLRDELLLGRHGEAGGAARTVLRVDYAGQPLLRQSVEVSGSDPVALGPAVLSCHRAVGSLLLAGEGADGSGTEGGARVGRATPERAVMPLIGPGVLVTALAGDAVALRRRLGDSLGVPRGTRAGRGVEVDWVGEFVRVEVADRIATIRLDRPKMNALNAQVQGEIAEAARQVSADDAVRAVILYGGMRVFAAGADIKEMAPLGYAEMAERAAALQAALNVVAGIPKPVVAAVTGYALGGGLELALCADFRVLGESAKVGQPEILLGVIPGAGGTQRLPRLIGPARAKDLIFTGRQVTAEEALAIGLADRVAPDAGVYEAARDLVAQYTTGPALALRAAKQAVNQGLEVDLATGLEIERLQFAGLFATADQKAGMRSFMENGPGKAVFEGR